MIKCYFSFLEQEQLATIPKAWCRGSGGKIGKAQSVKKPVLSQHGLKCRGLSSVYGSHLQQAISLGWDRRYNGYWLFLGPCGFDDPGHRRVYFESSEDGHWEVIDSAQVCISLIRIYHYHHSHFRYSDHHYHHNKPLLFT